MGGRTGDREREAPVVSGAALPAIAVATIVVLGLNWPIMSTGVQAITPMWLASMRLLGAGVVVGIGMGMTGRLRLPGRSDYSIVLSVAALRLAIVYGLVFSALAIVPPGRSSMLVYTSSLWTAPLAAWLLRERLTALKVGAVLIGVVGVVLLIEPWGADASATGSVAGYGMLLGAALATAAGTVHIRGHRWTGSPLSLMPWQLLLAGVLTSIAAIALEGAPRVDWDLSAVAIVAYQIVLATAFGLWGLLTLGRSLPALSTSLLLMAVPVVGVLGSVAFVGEGLTGATVGGMALVLAAVGSSVVADHATGNRT